MSRSYYRPLSLTAIAMLVGIAGACLLRRGGDGLPVAQHVRPASVVAVWVEEDAEQSIHLVVGEPDDVGGSVTYLRVADLRACDVRGEGAGERRGDSSLGLIFARTRIRRLELPTFCDAIHTAVCLGGASRRIVEGTSSECVVDDPAVVEWACELRHSGAAPLLLDHASSEVPSSSGSECVWSRVLRRGPMANLIAELRGAQEESVSVRSARELVHRVMTASSSETVRAILIRAAYMLGGKPVAWNRNSQLSNPERKSAVMCLLCEPHSRQKTARLLSLLSEEPLDDVRYLIVEYFWRRSQGMHLAAPLDSREGSLLAFRQMQSDLRDRVEPSSALIAVGLAALGERQGVEWLRRAFSRPVSQIPSYLSEFASWSIAFPRAPVWVSPQEKATVVTRWRRLLRDPDALLYSPDLRHFWMP